jgi:hypothetical protein
VAGRNNKHFVTNKNVQLADMYIKKEIVAKVMDLFSKQPKYRDERLETVKIVSEQIAAENGLDLWGTVLVAFDVDRTFRYVQQHVPSLRGDTWLARQRQSGEISEEEYQSLKEHLDFIKDLAEENKLGFQPSLFQ